MVLLRLHWAAASEVVVVRRDGRSCRGVWREDFEELCWFLEGRTCAGDMVDRAVVVGMVRDSRLSG